MNTADQRKFDILISIWGNKKEKRFITGERLLEGINMDFS